MCTIGTDRSLNIIFKNRDKNIDTTEEVIHGKGFLAVRTKGAGYYSLGFNDMGCGFVSAAVNSPEWTYLAENGKAEAAKELAQKENEGLVSPTVIVSSMLSEISTVDEWINSIERQKVAYKGYKVLMADKCKACIVETYKNKVVVTDFPSGKGESTNHFFNIKFGPIKYEDYPSSFDRYKYITEKMRSVKKIEDVFLVLNPKDPSDRERIWRSGKNGKFFTISSSVVDLKRKCLYFLKNGENQYKKTCIQ
ncbi:MAG TPA: carcinine hydrolase/isopenicillin-N N-acyltransferase family protein [Candidatus Omnitrophota bacterium]|nr:carcinine hydrolase/isopenicillin-N N-acyltransferase family protein [Candidatus Omnitrophota bacterium]HPS19518.1 carcinine hydrolase/isopenicillin-N N-acyltransferase family protein [Candidatus Omnitrophota bacterium]